MQIVAPPELKSYLHEPFFIAPHQCLAHANNRRIKTKEATLDYYGLDITGQHNLDKLQEGAIIEVLESKPLDILKQLSFYKKCKTISITKEKYDYMEQLANSIAKVNVLKSIAKPAINISSSNCKYIHIPWSISFQSRRIDGTSMCLVATKDIEPASTLLYEQSRTAMLKARRRLLARYPVMFVVDQEHMVPLEVFDAPVKVKQKLINFTTVPNKTEHVITFDKTLGAYKNEPSCKRRKVYLEKDGKVYKVKRIEDPKHLK